VFAGVGAMQAGVGSSVSLRTRLPASVTMSASAGRVTGADAVVDVRLPWEGAEGSGATPQAAQR
jgi:hypothetical protein